MSNLQKIYDFVDLAEKNRKYPANTAHGRRAALKLFDTVLTEDERDSVTLIRERMNEIYLNLISKHKESFSIKSLNTYKGRFLKLLEEYEKYGLSPDGIVHWEAKERKYTVKNMKDTIKDVSFHNLSFPIHKGVHKFQVALEHGDVCNIELPADVTSQDIATIKKIIDSLKN